ncbi:MAG: hypothetical protein UHS54_01625 [Lachnospiraceae bacterium]|nr:hypothetical protein [Lachnospiraceae bacterium]
MIFDAAKRGLLLWFEQLIPSLLPFIICSNLLISLLGNMGHHASGSGKISAWTKRFLGFSPMGIYALCMGHLCGYPAGAKITADLFLRNQISKKEADDLLMTANQASPAFLASYLTIYTLDNPALLIPVFCIFYGATLITACIIRFLPQKQNMTNTRIVCAETNQSFMQLVDYSIVDGFSTMIRVGGYVILFSILSAFAVKLFSWTGNLKYLISSILEMTNGLDLLKSAPYSIHMKWLAAMGCTAFGGFSTMAQIKGMLIGTPLSIKPYIIGKCIYTVVVLLISELFFRISFVIFQ